MALNLDRCWFIYQPSWFKWLIKQRLNLFYIPTAKFKWKSTFSSFDGIDFSILIVEN